MRMVAIVLLGVFIAGVILLSRAAEQQANDFQLYHGDNLIKAIAEHNEKKTFSFGGDAPLGPPPTRDRIIIGFGGKTAVVPAEVAARKPDNTVPATNDGQPGRPLPLTLPPPMNPVYK